jgi:hypothetical protein
MFPRVVLTYYIVRESTVQVAIAKQHRDLAEFC